jgi:hypothetical protein
LVTPTVPCALVEESKVPLKSNGALLPENELLAIGLWMPSVVKPDVTQA